MKCDKIKKKKIKICKNKQLKLVKFNHAVRKVPHACTKFTRYRKFYSKTRK